MHIFVGVHNGLLCFGVHYAYFLKNTDFNSKRLYREKRKFPIARN